MRQQRSQSYTHDVGAKQLHHSVHRDIAAYHLTYQQLSRILATAWLHDIYDTACITPFQTPTRKFHSTSRGMAQVTAAAALATTGAATAPVLGFAKHSRCFAGLGLPSAGQRVADVAWHGLQKAGVQGWHQWTWYRRAAAKAARQRRGSSPWLSYTASVCAWSTLLR